jgi:hypothetical protein
VGEIYVGLTWERERVLGMYFTRKWSIPAVPDLRRAVLNPRRGFQHLPHFSGEEACYIFSSTLHSVRG